MRHTKTILFLLTILASCTNTSQETYYTIKVADKSLKVDICATNRARDKIANYLSYIKDDKGYLLCYPRERLQSFYYAGNSPLNASVAFISAGNEIDQIEDYSEKGVYSTKPARFVLLTNKGWLEKNNIHENTKVELPQDALKAEELCTVTIKDAVSKVELATTRLAREQGLKFRKTLNKDEGMLFIYNRPNIHKFWMQDTVAPLSLAYIKSDWTISSIHDLKPFDENEVPSIEPTQFVLEVAQGWFDQHNIKAGDKVSFSGNLNDLDID